MLVESSPNPQTVAGDRTPGAGAPASKNPQPADITPRTVVLPNGSAAEFFRREHLTYIYRCSHGELGRLLARRLAPLPIRVDGEIIWWVDEVMAMAAQVTRTLERWRR